MKTTTDPTKQLVASSSQALILLGDTVASPGETNASNTFRMKFSSYMQKEECLPLK